MDDVKTNPELRGQVVHMALAKAQHWLDEWGELLRYFDDVHGDDIAHVARPIANSRREARY